MQVIPQVYRAEPGEVGEVPAVETPGYCPSCGGPCGLRPAGGRTRAVRWAPLCGPHLDLAFDGDRVALAALAEGRLPLLPIDPRFRRWPRCG